MFNYEIAPQVREVNDPCSFTLTNFDERSLHAFEKALQKARSFDQPIFPIKIQSDGGSVAIMLGFMSLMKKYREQGMKFISIVAGTAASAGCVIFLYCDERYMGEFASLMFHASFCGLEGPLPSIKNRIDWFNKEETKVNEVLSLHRKRPKGWIEGQLKKRGASEDWSMNAQEALDLKMATKIGIPTLTLVLYAGFSID